MFQKIRKSFLNKPKQNKENRKNISNTDMDEENNLLEKNDSRIESLEEMEENNFTLKFSISKKRGNTDPNKKDNNSIVLIKKPELNFYYFGVFDSHGSSGKEVSDTLSNFFQITIENNYKTLLKMKNYQTIKNFLQNLVYKAEDNLRANNIDLKYSGSVMNNLLIINKKVYIINLGNSKSILYREKDDKKFAIELSNSHIPENKEERYRIYKNGGIIERAREYEGEATGPLRIWDKKIENGPGIEITRSIGDTQATLLGVINKPEIQEFDIKEFDQFFVIGTNGFWELIFSTQVVYYVKKFLDLFKNNFEKCAEFLIKKAVKKGSEDYEGSKFRYADMTIIIVYIDR